MRRAAALALASLSGVLGCGGGTAASSPPKPPPPALIEAGTSRRLARIIPLLFRVGVLASRTCPIRSTVSLWRHSFFSLSAHKATSAAGGLRHASNSALASFRIVSGDRCLPHARRF